ncbi:MAG: LytTR family transcriptional regulator DNA-binding domain-containing protein, partial [Lachnospiraceae bacterium]|nr:LytTR family transcriptional regulator DNA-binding domain-containing protein [Lachnospiraceae bacterium]
PAQFHLWWCQVRGHGGFEKELDERFFRVGRAFILNLNQVRRVTRKEVILSDNTALPLPRGAYEALNRAIINLS